MRVLSTAAGLLILVACALVQGRWTGRWGADADLGASAARLAELPRTIGTWHGVDRAMSAEDLRAAGGAGTLVRTYTREDGGRSLTVFLLCGRPGPVSVHTPDVCYASAGYDLVGAPATKTVDCGGLAAEFRTAEARPEAADGEAPLHLYWSWGAAGKWDAPANPRLAFARHKVLYKLYVFGPARDAAGPANDKDALEFIRQLMPEVERALFPDS